MNLQEISASGTRKLLMNSHAAGMQGIIIRSIILSMLALLATTGSAFLLQVPSRPSNAPAVPTRSVEVRMRAPDEDFDQLFFKGGEAVTDGDMCVKADSNLRPLPCSCLEP